MSADKLSIINDMLAQTGDNAVATPDDGSDEWIVCSAAYDTALDLTIERHTWNFGTNVATLNRVGNSPDDLYSDAFAFPQGAMRLIWVRLHDATVDYKIINGLICLTAGGQSATGKYVVDPGSKYWPPLFTAVIRLHVRAAIYRGLHEDLGQADKEEQKAEMMLQEARTTVDQNAPKRAMFNSRARIARRVRRPWIGSPSDFGGTGIPN